jgi:predicted O-methyltransferase YrrM
MFHNIPGAFLDRMQYLEQVDARDRTDGTPDLQRLRQIPREVGKFLSILAASAPKGIFLEIGTSVGYSTLWLAIACLETARKLTTFELSAEKATMARETFRATGLENLVDCVEGDARERLNNYEQISFCFLDAEKVIYLECYEIIVPRMVKGGLLVADNVISHRESLCPFIERAISDERVDALIVPIGLGELVCRKI